MNASVLWPVNSRHGSDEESRVVDQTEALSWPLTFITVPWELMLQRPGVPLSDSLLLGFIFPPQTL